MYFLKKTQTSPANLIRKSKPRPVWLWTCGLPAVLGRKWKNGEKKMSNSCNGRIYVYYYPAYHSSLVFKWAQTGTSSSFHTHLLPVNPGSHATWTAISNLSTYAPVEVGGISANVNCIPSWNRTLQIHNYRASEIKINGCHDLEAVSRPKLFDCP